MKLTRQYQKLKKSYIKVAVATCLFVIFTVPFASRFSNTEEVNAETIPEGRIAYSVVLNGQEIGVVEDTQIAKDLLLDVRAQINEENDSTVYADADISFYTNVDYSGSLTSNDVIKSRIYQNIMSSAYIANDKAYTLRINDFMVTLRTQEEVVEVLTAVKNRMAGTEDFQIEVVDETSNSLSQKTINFVCADIAVNQAARVLATIDGAEVVKVTDDTVFEDGVLYVGFEENIEIIETRGMNDSIVSVEEAYELITREKAEKDIYEVVAGDCLSSIAEKNNISLADIYELNENLNANSIIGIGDLITITVPKPELSVVVKEEVTYEEEYDADIIYVDNNSMYQGDYRVISNGVPGYREVKALISSSNGKEYSREILHQTIITEAVAKVVERGTLIPPTFIKPVNSNYVTSSWGSRIHPITGAWSFHTGIDWYVPLDTAVKASCGGTVTYAGWNGGYGNCVDISHGNGLTTRYAHLNSIEVYVGQTVSQSQRIGLSGSTGYSTGPHLHFEVLKWGTSQQPLDYVK